MNIIDIIDKKRKKEELTDEEIKYVVNSFVSGEIKDYQMSSLLMAICINDMSDNEIFALTDIFINSGNKLELSEVEGIIVDKHSTGGIGDTTTLVVGPILASLGIKMAKISGRGLGITGGTIDVTTFGGGSIGVYNNGTLTITEEDDEDDWMRDLVCQYLREQFPDRTSILVDVSW